MNMNKIVKLTFRPTKSPIYVITHQVLHFREFNGGTLLFYNNKENRIVVTETPEEVMEAFTNNKTK